MAQTKAEIQAELHALKAAHERLKRDVVAKAKELTDEHGWCDAANRALSDLGLVNREPVTVKVTIRTPDDFMEQVGYPDLEDAVIGALDYYSADAIDAEVVKADAR